jgi:hypothetical protein
MATKPPNQKMALNVSKVRKNAEKTAKNLVKKIAIWLYQF